MIDKILSAHLDKKAVVYLRQSSPTQVREHRESTARQYGLRERALGLGWNADTVEIIDDDLGQSGEASDWREGFQRMAEDIAHGRVGALFALEVSRLARSSADWYRLLELAGLADVLIADESRVYNPRDYDDRLLLGLKGQFAEAERYWMRLRLNGAKMSKARRGEIVFTPPTGYLWGEEGRLRVDPDEKVQASLRLIFERFRLDGSAAAVVRYFARHGLQMPVRDNGELRWTPPRLHWVFQVLHNPAYAGAYVFGRREHRTALVDGQVRRRRTTELPLESWKVCLQDRHEAYVSWDEFMANQDKLRSNAFRWRPKPEQRGAPRDGAALLQGIVLCGRCGHRMYARHGGRYSFYECRGAKYKDDGSMAGCWVVSAAQIDSAVTAQFLEVIRPAEIDLALAVARDAERQADEIRRQWKLRLEHARYEARLCERRYKAVDPDNRTVARTLEREWNDKLEEAARLEGEYESVRRREKVELSDEDRRQVLALARDLPRVWNAPTTTAAERKNLLRMLIREVALSPVDVPERSTRVQVLWVTGATSELRVPRPDGGTALRTASEAVALVRSLYDEGRSDEAIAEVLNDRRLPTGRGGVWTADTVAWVRRTRGLPRKRGASVGRRPPLQREDGLYSTRGVAELLEMPVARVYVWVKQGHLVHAEGGAGRTVWFRLDADDIERLQRLRASRVARGYRIGGPRGREREKGISEEEVHCG